MLPSSQISPHAPWMIPSPHAGPPPQTPAVQTSSMVHIAPSSHAVPSGTTQSSAASLQTSLHCEPPVQGSPALTHCALPSQVSAPVQNRSSSQSASVTHETQAGGVAAAGTASTAPSTPSHPGFPGPAAQPHQLFSNVSVGLAPFATPALSLFMIASSANDTVAPAGSPP